MLPRHPRAIAAVPPDSIGRAWRFWVVEIRSAFRQAEVRSIRGVFRETLPPVAESMPPFHFEGTQLQPLTTCPRLGSTRMIPGRQPRVTEQSGPETKTGMVAIPEGRETDGFLRDDILAEIARPEPTHAELIVQKRIDRIYSPILLLDSLDPFPVDLCNHLGGSQRSRPAITRCFSLAAMTISSGC